MALCTLCVCSSQDCDDQEAESNCSDTSTASTVVAFGVNTYAEFVHKFSHIVYRNVRGAHFKLPDDERITLDAGLEYFKRCADMFLMDTSIVRTANGLSVLNIVKPMLLLISGLFLEEHRNNDNVTVDAVQVAHRPCCFTPTLLTYGCASSLVTVLNTTSPTRSVAMSKTPGNSSFALSMLL